MANEYNQIEIAKLANEIVNNLEESNETVELKVAALKSAAAILENALAAKAMTAFMFQTLNSNRKQ